MLLIKVWYVWYWDFNDCSLLVRVLVEDCDKVFDNFLCLVVIWVISVCRWCFWVFFLENRFLIFSFLVLYFVFVEVNFVCKVFNDMVNFLFSYDVLNLWMILKMEIKFNLYFFESFFIDMFDLWFVKRLIFFWVFCVIVLREK